MTQILRREKLLPTPPIRSWFSNTENFRGGGSRPNSLVTILKLILNLLRDDATLSVGIVSHFIIKSKYFTGILTINFEARNIYLQSAFSMMMSKRKNVTLILVIFILKTKTILRNEQNVLYQEKLLEFFEVFNTTELFQLKTSQNGGGFLIGKLQYCINSLRHHTIEK